MSSLGEFGVWVLREYLYTTFVISIFASKIFSSSLLVNIGPMLNHVNPWYSLIYVVVFFSTFYSFQLRSFSNP